MNQNTTHPQASSLGSNQPLDLLRDQMPVAQQYAYFDHAAVAPLPVPCVQAMRLYSDEAMTHGDAQWLRWAQELESLRGLSASLLNAETEEIALIPNTTHGIQCVAQGIRWEVGDNLVVPSNEFPSNLLPWRELKSRGVEVRELDVGPDGTIDLAKLDQLIDARTRVLAISWVGYASGYRIPVAEVTRIAHAKHCWVMLDAIQGLGAFPLDVQATQVDFVAADGHKWLLGPEGAGLLYCRAELLDQLTPVGTGWNSLAQGAFDGKPHQLKQTASRYEGGTLNMAGFHGLKQSMQLLLEHGLNQHDSPVAAAIQGNVSALEELLTSAGFQVLLPQLPERRSGIVGLTWPAAQAEPKLLAAARLHLMDQKIVTSVRANRLRVSTHAYNNLQDVERLVAELTQFCRQHR